MSRNRELIKNTIIIALGKICTQFVTFFLLPVYTRFLSTAEYGTLDLVLTCTNLVSPILSLQLERSVFRFLIDARKDDRLQKTIVSTAFGAIVPSIILLSIIMPVLAILFNIQYWEYILAIIIASILSNIALQIPRGMGHNIHYSIGSAIDGVSNALISILSVTVFGLGIRGILIANIISHILSFIYISISMGLFSKVRLSSRNKTTLKKLLKFSIPMIPNDICYWIISASDRILIFFLINEEANGVYATATKFPALIVSAYNIFNMSWMETVSAHINDHDAADYLSATFNEIVRASGGFCLVVGALFLILFDVVIGESFADSYQYITALVFGSFFSIIVGALSALYFGYKKTVEIAKTNALAAAVNIIINITLIWFIGIWAAVISTIIAYAVVAIYRVIDISKVISLKIRVFDFVAIIIVFTASVLLLHDSNSILRFAYLGAVSLFAAILNRGLIIRIVSIIKKGFKNEKIHEKDY